MMIIKNRETIIEQLQDMLIQFAKDMNEYQTDVYLYYNEEEQMAELDTFVNVGGNSWRNDEHYTIYSDKQHFENVMECFDELEDVLSAASGYDKEKEQEIRRDIIKHVAEIDGVDISEAYVTDIDIKDYIKHNDELFENVCNAYNDYVDETASDYYAEAEEIISRFEREN